MPLPIAQPWNCRKCGEQQQPKTTHCAACGASRKPTGAERAKTARAEAVRQAQLAGNLWGAVGEPPVEQGCDAISEWLNDVNSTVGRAIDADFPDQIKIRVLQTMLKAATRAKNKENAPHRERLLQARELREGVPYRAEVVGLEPPEDVQALPLWWYFRLCRLIHDAAHVAEMSDDMARKYRSLCDAAQAGLYLREQHKTEAFLEEHGIKDVHRVAIDTAKIWPVIETESRPAAPGTPVLFSANPGPQSTFVDSRVDEILYGGRTGGGKSAGLLIAALAHLFAYPHPRNAALIARYTWQEIPKQPFFKMAQLELGKLQRRGYPVAWHGDQRYWDLGDFGQLWFGYLDSLTAANRYQGGEFCFLGVDEGTLVPPEPVEILAAERMRTQPGVPAIVRLTANPGGPYHEHYFKAYAPWLNRRQDYLEAAARGVVPLAGPGEVLYYLIENGKEVWVPAGTKGARSRTYLPAGVEHTPQYDSEQYESNLAKIRDPLRLAQMRDGDWSAQYAAGEIFRRAWWRAVGQAPGRIVRMVRAWDMAWGVSSGACWTVGLLLGELEGGSGWVVLDVIRLRGTEGTTRPTIRRVAEIDGRAVVVRLPADMGLAGQLLRDNYVTELAGFDVRLTPDKGDKFERARPVAAQLEYGHIYILAGSHPTRELAAELVSNGVECTTGYEWAEGLVGELEKIDPRYPKKVPLDQMDALSGAFEFLHTDRSLLPAPGLLRGASEVIQRAFGVGAAHAAPPAASWAPSVARGGGRRTGMI